MVLLIRIFVVFFISVTIHEVGHLLGGKISGFKFDSLVVGLLYFYKENNKLKFKLNRLTSLNFFSGHCFMIPNQGFESFNPFWITLGGVLLNFLTTLLLFIIIENIELNEFLMSWLRPLIIVNFVIGLGNLIPLKFPQQTDGYNMMKSLQSKEYKRGVYVAFILDKELKEGKRFKDFDFDLLFVEPSVKINSFFVAFLVMIYAYHLADKGEHEAAMKEFNRFDFKLLLYEMRCEVKCEMLYYYLIYNFDVKKCQELYEDEELKDFLQQNKAISKRVLATYTWIVLGEIDKGEQLINEATMFAHRLEGGYKAMELASIEDFRTYQGIV